jgi:Mg2+ and Co2+ transporter CorA
MSAQDRRIHTMARWKTILIFLAVIIFSAIYGMNTGNVPETQHNAATL